MICRYLNSGLPVTVATGSHAFVLIGYGHRPEADRTSTLYFVRHDDEIGPYQEVDWQLDLPYGEVRLNMARRLALGSPTPPVLDEDAS